MNERNESLAAMLNKGARTLAAYASNDLLEIEPQADSDFGPSSFSAWQNWFAARLGELAAAIASNQPQRFADHVCCAKAVLEARDISAEHPRIGLECLNAVLAKELPSEVRSIAAEYLNLALAQFERQYAAISTPLLTDSPLGRLVAEYLLALLEGNRLRASGLIHEKVQQGENVADLYMQVLVPALEEIGRMWLANEINVAEEHFATATTRAVMAQLHQFAAFKPGNGKTFLCAAVTGNQHDLGLQVVADLFEMEGWRAIQLGADMPVNDIVQAVDFFNTDLLGLSASLSAHLQALKDTIAAVRSSSKRTGVKILVGGFALDNSEELLKYIGADAYAPTAVQAVVIGNELVGLPKP
jgi:MerR family transcriptional regulator, light-induced transcriptional regulator